MITLLKRIFIENWQRKLISLVLAMIIWVLVHHSMVPDNQPSPFYHSTDNSSSNKFPEEKNHIAPPQF